jgi:hypothetical protein
VSDDQYSASGPETATALAEPPGPPRTPGTATATPPPPKRRRWIGWAIGILCLVLVVGALVGVVVWARTRNAPTTDFSAYRPGFESAMRKAGTTATFPAAPVDLQGVSATGSHSFEATFTADEITALVNVFPWTTEIQGTPVAVSGARIGFPSAGNASLRARVKVSGSSYSGTVEAPVRFQMGAITSTGATKVLAEGIAVKGDRAAQATDMLLVYLNAYLAAAPGLDVYAADVTNAGVHVKGSAPDALVMP